MHYGLLSLLLFAQVLLLAQAGEPAKSPAADAKADIKAETVPKAKKLQASIRDQIATAKEQRAKLKTDIDKLKNDLAEEQKKNNQLAGVENPDASTKADKTKSDQNLERLQQDLDLAQQRWQTIGAQLDEMNEQIATIEMPATESPAEGSVPADPAAKPASPAPVAAAVPATAPTAPAADATTAAPATTELQSSATLSARRAREVKERIARETQQQAEAAADVKGNVEHALQLEQRTLELANQNRQTLQKTVDKLKLDLAEAIKSSDNASADKIRQQIDSASQDQATVFAEIKRRTHTIELLQKELDELQSKETELYTAANTAKRSADRARDYEWFVTIRQEVIRRTPGIVGTLVIMLFLWWVVSAFSRRMERIVARTGRGSPEEREQRAHTLMLVFHNTATTAVLIGGILMVLEQISIPVAPLVAGAGVFGIAFAFGAQNLIRDFFYGFMILLENQYKINDSVTIGGITGTVESITLRMTSLRGPSGSVHFIPNGEIKIVSNHSREYRRLLVDISVPRGDDLDARREEVQNLLNSFHDREVSQSSNGSNVSNGPNGSAGLGGPSSAAGNSGITSAKMVTVLGTPQYEGIESVDEQMVTLRFAIKANPQRSDSLRRELIQQLDDRYHNNNIRTTVQG